MTHNPWRPAEFWRIIPSWPLHWGSGLRTNPCQHRIIVVTVRILLLSLWLLVGCRDQSDAIWTGDAGFNFHGFEFELPNNGKGKMVASPHEIDFAWEGKLLTIRDNGDGTVSITTPVTTRRLSDRAQVIRIDSKGTISNGIPAK